MVLTILLRSYIQHSVYVLIAVYFCLFLNARSYGQAVIYPGMEPAFESGASQTNTRGPEAVLWNPANIILTKKREVYADISILNVSYTYTKPGYDPIPIKITAPPVNFGTAWRPKNNFAIGIFFIPRPGGSNALTLSNLPLDTGLTTRLVVDATVTSSTIISGFGIAFRPKNNLSIGLSIIQTAEDSQLIARKAGTTDDANVEAAMRTQGEFYQFIGGMRLVLPEGHIVAGSFKPATVKTYRGSQIIRGDQDENIQKKGFDPAVFALGFEYVIGQPRIFAEARYERWSAGKDASASGFPGDSGRRAYVDVLNLVLGGRIRFDSNKMFSASFGYYPANVGIGTQLSDTQNPDALMGVQIGEMENINRTMFSALMRVWKKQFDLRTGFNFISGSRTVPDGFPGYGKYDLTTITLGVGGSWFF